MTDNNTNTDPAAESTADDPGSKGGHSLPTLVQPKLTLAANDDDDDDDAEELPGPIIRRLLGLKQIQEQYETLEAQYKTERIILEQKYFSLRQPLFEQRRDVVSGAVDVEIEDELEGAGDADTSVVNGIPNFWLQCLVNHPLLGQLVEDDDHAALATLMDIRVEYNDLYSIFKIIFTFGDNEFFTNKELIKVYEVAPDLLDDKAPALTNVDGTEIDWKPKKNLCTEETRKKQKGGNKGGKKGGQVKYVTAQVAKASFFHFFSDPHMEDDEDDDEDHPVFTGGRKHEHQLSVDADYEVGHSLRTEIVPNAVAWFTGEAGDEDDEDGLDLDDDDDDEDEDDPDEESEDVMVGKSGGAAAGNTEQPECKQS